MHKLIKAAVVLSACVSAPWAMAEASDSVQQVQYQCERGVAVPVTYLNTASGGSYAAVSVKLVVRYFKRLVSSFPALRSSLFPG